MPAPFDEQPTCATSTTTTPHPYPLASSLSAPRLNQQTLDQSNHPSIHPPERFMQPEPSTESPTKSKEHTQQEETPTTTQHGLYERDQPGDAPHQSDVAATDAHSGLTRDEQLAADAAFAASLQEERRSSPERRVETGRVSAKHKPSPPSRNRIAEYEEASTTRTKRREPPGFEVIKKPRNPEDKRSAIQEMPNGMSFRCRIHSRNELTLSRGTGTCSCTPSAERLDVSRTGLEAIPRSGYWPVCVEECVCPLLSRSGLNRCAFPR